MKSSYFLTIPTQQNPAQKLFKFEAKQLRQWVSELPIVNPSHAARLILDHAIEFNSFEMPSSSRLEALEILWPSISTIENNVRNQITKYGFPKNENDHKILNVLTSVHKEFSIGYWIAAKELTKKPAPWLRSKNVVLALHRCMKEFSNIVFNHSIMGLPLPDWVWMDLHSLYRLSVKLNLQTTQVYVDPNQLQKKSTPEDCYKQIILFYLSEPAGMMQKEMMLVFNSIENLAPFLSFQNKPVANQGRQCLILIDEDKPPLFQSEDASHSGKACLYINFQNVYKTIEQKLRSQSLPQGRFTSTQLSSDQENPSSDLLVYLVQRWMGQKLQCASLFNDRLNCYLAIGLTFIYSLTIPADAKEKSPLEFMAESESENILSCQFHQYGVLSVGSLICFRKAVSSGFKPALGIVFKIFATKQSSKIYFGIQPLSTHFFAVTYFLYSAKEKVELQRALFFTRTENEKENSFIIVDNFNLKEGDTLQINRKNESFQAVLKNRKNIGIGYLLLGLEKK